LSLPGISGIEATHQIHAELPNVHVIGLSMFEEKERAKAMFDAGADAYLNKSCSVETLAAAIRRSSKKTDQQ
jgi:DNA-binding NarL/FixJ family response regulator